MTNTDPKLEAWKMNHAAAVSSGTEAVKTTLLINGGAAIAVLAFIGGVASQGRISPSDINEMARGLSWFGCGVFFAALAMGLAYLANRAILNTIGMDSPLWNFISACVQVATVIAVIASLVSFPLGLADVRTSIGKLHFIEPSMSSTLSGPVKISTTQR